MKTKEFVKKIAELGYKVDENDNRIRVGRGSDLVAIVYKNKVNSLETFWDEAIPTDVFDLCVEYARTPIEEREDSKRYYLYNPVKNLYFKYKREAGLYGWGTHRQTSVSQTQFTEEEIKNNPYRDIMELLEKKEVQ